MLLYKHLTCLKFSLSLCPSALSYLLKNSFMFCNFVILQVVSEVDIAYVKSVNWRTFHSTDTTICVYKILQINVHWGIVIINIEGSIISSV